MYAICAKCLLNNPPARFSIAGNEVEYMEQQDSLMGDGEEDIQHESLQNRLLSAEGKRPHIKLANKIPRKHQPSDKDYIKKRRTKVVRKKSLKRKAPGEQDDGNWEVEYIVDMDKMFGEVKFLVKWKGWGSEYNSWEPLRNVYNCQKLIQDYFKKNQSAALEAQLKGEPTDDHLKEKAEELVQIDSETLEEFMETVRVNGQLQFHVPSKEELNLKMKSLFKQDVTKEMKSDATKAILCHKLGVLRKQQLLQLADWQNEMNLLAPNEAPIVVENNVDLEVAPIQFTYIANYIPGPGVSLPEDPPIGCACSTCGPRSFCCNAHNDADFAYSKHGKLAVLQGTPIYECNKKCGCGDDCSNKVVQKGRQVRLSIYRTTNGCGWGVKAKQLIKKGTFVCQYVGEVITSEEAEIRGEKYDADGRTYLFDLDFNDPDNCMYTVDAAMYGNISHFINHSCDPNCGVFAVWINCLDPNIPCLGLFALRDIVINEEISFNYTSQFLNKANAQSSLSQSRMSRSILTDLNLSTASSTSRTECKCNSSNCRKYLF